MIYYFILKYSIFDGMEDFFSSQKIKMFRGGWGNGYVLIPNGHPYYKYGTNYNNYPIRAHGGLTHCSVFNKEFISNDNIELEPILSEHINTKGIEFLSDYYILGFDTGHYGDTPDNWDKDRVRKESMYLKKQCLDTSIPEIAKWIRQIRKIKLQQLDK